MSKEDLLHRLFSGDRPLPTLPVLFNQLNEMMQNPFESNQRIAALIMKDQSLVTKILKLSNCAMYSKRQDITNLANAITFLGTTTIRNLIMQISLVRVFHVGGDEIPGFRIETFWEHSLGTAYFTKEIAQRLNLPPSDDYYIAGLLHDIGKLVIYQFYPHRFKEIVKTQINDGLPDYEAEENVLGVSHQEVGTYLSEKWKFKKEIIAAIRDHHKSIPTLPLHAAVVRISNLFTKAAALCFPWDKRVFEITGDPAWQILSQYKKEPIDVERMTFEITDETGDIRDFVKELLGKKRIRP